jgi:hypothetical protein
MSKFTEVHDMSGPRTESISHTGTTTSTSAPANTIEAVAGPASKRTRKLDFGFLPIPKNRRHDPNVKPEEQFLFTLKMNLVFATAAVGRVLLKRIFLTWLKTVSVMNLYYIQVSRSNRTILIANIVKAHACTVCRSSDNTIPSSGCHSIATDFGVSYDEVSVIPTLAQAGYGVGIVLITPLGDLVRRRQLVLLLMFLATTLSIGLALSRNVKMLEGISFVVGMLTVGLSGGIWIALNVDHR